MTPPGPGLVPWQLWTSTGGRFVMWYDRNYFNNRWSCSGRKWNIQEQPWWNDKSSSPDQIIRHSRTISPSLYLSSVMANVPWIKVFFVTRAIWSWAIFLSFFPIRTRGRLQSSIIQASAHWTRQRKYEPTFGLWGVAHVGGNAHFTPRWGWKLILHAVMPVNSWCRAGGEGGGNGGLIRVQARRSQVKMEHCSQPSLFPANNGTKKSSEFHWKAKINGRGWGALEYI